MYHPVSFLRSTTAIKEANIFHEIINCLSFNICFFLNITLFGIRVVFILNVQMFGWCMLNCVRYPNISNRTKCLKTFNRKQSHQKTKTKKNNSSSPLSLLTCCRDSIGKQEGNTRMVEDKRG